MTFKVSLWVLALMFIIGFSCYQFGFFKKTTKTTSYSSTVVQYLEKAEEVVFLNAGINKVRTLTKRSKIPFTSVGVPLSKKTVLYTMNYTAKFGIKKPVKIKKRGEHHYHITVPEYDVIGIKVSKGKDRYKLYDKKGELLSFGTEDIDTGETVTEEVTDKEQKKYPKEYHSLISDSAKDYYSKIIKAIDADAKLTFDLP